MTRLIPVTKLGDLSKRRRHAVFDYMKPMPEGQEWEARIAAARLETGLACMRAEVEGP